MFRNGNVKTFKNRQLVECRKNAKLKDDKFHITSKTITGVHTMELVGCAVVFNETYNSYTVLGTLKAGFKYGKPMKTVDEKGNPITVRLMYVKPEEIESGHKLVGF